MAIDSHHPLFDAILPDWERMSDTFDGERAVKAAGTKYLPVTAGMVADGYPKEKSVGLANYNAYKERAVFHGYVTDAVKTLAGIMRRKEPTIELPARLDGMLELATPDGESLQTLLRKVQEELLKTGRLGLLLELPIGQLAAEAIPMIAAYGARSMINWDTGVRVQGRRRLELVVLDESGYERNNEFDWDLVKQYRVLRLSGSEGEGQDRPADGTYQVAVVRDDDAGLTLSEEMFTTPRGINSLTEIPFVFINANDLVPAPCIPPLIALANLDIAIYRGEADYRQTLFMQGQATLVRKGDGGDEEVKVGAGAVMNVGLDGDAKYITAPADGLSEQRSALENDKTDAGQMAGRLVDSRTRQRESGDALHTRMSARSASLSTMATTAAEGLATILRFAAEVVGANPDEVVVEPNLDFSDDVAAEKALSELMKSKAMGAPLSDQTIHQWAVKHELTGKTYEEESAEIEEEDAEKLSKAMESAKAMGEVTGEEDGDKEEDDE